MAAKMKSHTKNDTVHQGKEIEIIITGIFHNRAD